LVAVEKFAKMGPQTLVFTVLPLAPHFIGTDGPTVSFSSNITIFSVGVSSTKEKANFSPHNSYPSKIFEENRSVSPTNHSSEAETKKFQPQLPVAQFHRNSSKILANPKAFTHHESTTCKARFLPPRTFPTPPSAL